MGTGTRRVRHYVRFIERHTDRSNDGAQPTTRQTSWFHWFDAPFFGSLHAASNAPARQIWLANHHGPVQVHAHDLSRHEDAVRVVSNSATDVTEAAIDADGSCVWWFVDDHGSESGLWVCAPFDPPSSPAPALVGVPLGRSRGLLTTTSRSVIAAIGVGPHTIVVSGNPDRPARTIAELSGDARLVDRCADTGDLLLSSAAPTVVGSVVHRIAPDGSTRASYDDDGLGVDAVAALEGGSFLATVARDGRLTPAIVQTDGQTVEVAHGLPDDVTARPHPQSGQMIFTRTHRGRSELHRARLDESTGAVTGLEPVDFPAGYVSSWAPHPSGAIVSTWSSSSAPLQILREGEAPSGLPDRYIVTDLDVPGPGGPIHVRLSGASPGTRHAAVFLVHGGPAHADNDAWNPARMAWEAAGYAVVQVNYRGSTGFGVDWLRANHGTPGLTELTDLVAVRDHLVAEGTIDPDRVAIVGRSWGGYLALLGVGVTPELWRAAVAEVPVGDPALVYDHMFEELRVAYRQRFGGPPSEAPDVYRNSSPLTYVEGVRAPVQVFGMRHDLRCPIEPIDAWVDAARAAGVDVDYIVGDGGHSSHVVSEQVATMARQLEFVSQHLR